MDSSERNEEQQTFDFYTMTFKVKRKKKLCCVLLCNWWLHKAGNFSPVLFNHK